jgi:protein-arginine kinase activator protein McsA
MTECENCNETKPDVRPAYMPDTEDETEEKSIEVHLCDECFNQIADATGEESQAVIHYYNSYTGKTECDEELAGKMLSGLTDDQDKVDCDDCAETLRLFGVGEERTLRRQGSK